MRLLFFKSQYLFFVVTLSFVCFSATGQNKSNNGMPVKPNIVLIYTDDVGYGDVSCNGYAAVKTVNIDKIASNGVRFTNVHATAATCTPSRFSLLTGIYAWRKQGTGIAPGDAALLIPTDKQTMPGMLQKAGYITGVVGKWHLGLGPTGGPDWNSLITPGPKEIGFDYSFLIPATGDRVPCVFVENQHIVGLQTSDPVTVSYKGPINPNDPTGKKNPELLKMLPSHGHDMTIVNGVSRIGYMTGGKAALWTDEDIADIITKKSQDFIEENKSKPFFLYFSTHDIHVPRMPNQRFVGKSGMGPRGDALLQLDWSVGQIMETLQKKQLLENTIVIFTSDNGAVIDDGYQDHAVEKLGNHKPSALFRGGKYSAFEGGTRVPFILSWKGKVTAGKTSDALLSQVDLYASLAALTGQQVPSGSAPDSQDFLSCFLNKSTKGRVYVVEQSINNTLSVSTSTWKYIEPSNGPAINKDTNTELGYKPVPQLYQLQKDIGETKNVASDNPSKTKEMEAILKQVKG